MNRSEFVYLLPSLSIAKIAGMTRTKLTIVMATTGNLHSYESHPYTVPLSARS